MSNEINNEVKDLREKNSELVMKVQYWKMTAAQRENEKLDLMKEMNELRLKLSRLRSGGAAHARKLDAALQSASEDVLSHLVQASSTVAHMLELNKRYMQDREELDAAQPKWSNLSNTPSSEKVNRVPPMLIGGRLIQPVVSLSRTLQSNNTRSSVRSPNQQNRNLSDSGLFAMHTLQDVYIPLTRIDATLASRSSDTQMDLSNDSTDEIGLEDSSERTLEEPEVMSDTQDFDESQRLEAVTEDVEPEETPQRPIHDNPLEGPSWLLDEPANRRSKSLGSLEPDSTTELEEAEAATAKRRALADHRVSAFTPTVRRRRRSPPAHSASHSPTDSTNGRVLKVLVAKMCLEEDDGSGDASPPKRPNVEETLKLRRPKEKSPKRKTSPNMSQGPIIREMSPSKRLMRFDAPSPNGSTDSRVIVLETSKTQTKQHNPTVDQCTRESRETIQNGSNEIGQDHSRDTRSHSRDTRSHSRDTRNHSRDNQSHNRDTQGDTSQGRSVCVSERDAARENRDSDSSGSETAGEGRTRRARKTVVYKEKPLNRKMRR